jgi:hypothetical protein
MSMAIVLLTEQYLDNSTQSIQIYAFDNDADLIHLTETCDAAGIEIDISHSDELYPMDGLACAWIRKPTDKIVLKLAIE